MADWKDLFTKYGGYGGDEDGSHVIFDSRNPKYSPKGEDKGNNKDAEKAANVLNKLRKDAAVLKQDTGIWKGVNSGYASNHYGQQAIQGVMDLMGMADGSDLIVYDTETLGTIAKHRKDKYNLDFYTPTEIGFKHVKMINGTLSTVDEAGKELGSLSMLMKPDRKVYERLDDILKGLTPGAWDGMTDDMRRTLADLTLYAGDPGQLFKVENRDGRRIVTVNKQSRELHPLKGSVLTSSENIALMRRGLDNLRDFGTSPEHAIQEMNAFMSGMSQVKFAGYNVYNFDQPMMLDYLNSQVGKHNPNSTVGKALDRLKEQLAMNQIDGLHAVRALYRNTFSEYGFDVTLETMKDVFGMTGGQAHHALSDVGVTIEQLNRIIKNPAINQVIRTGGKAGSRYGSFNTETIKTGDRLFAAFGLNSNKAGKYDGVYLSKNGKLESAYDMKANPIYRNATYRVDKFFDGIEMDGKKMYGVQLYNESDDLHHTIFRESKAELQNVIHGHFEHVGLAVDTANNKMSIAEQYLNAHGLQNEDRAARRWRKMFSASESGGGVKLLNRMLEALDIERKGRAEGLTEEEIKSKILGANKWNTDGFYRDYQTMRGRLEGEEKWLRGFKEKLEQSSLKGTSEYNLRTQSLALSEYRKLMDTAFGTNEVERKIPNDGVALSLKAGDQERLLNLTNADGIRGGLYGHLYRGQGRPNIAEFKKRFRDMLMQLKSYNALSAKQFETYYKKLDGVRHDVSFDNMLGELANTLAIARERGTLNGELDSIKVEDPTKLTKTRASAMEKAFDVLHNDLSNQAIKAVSPYQTFYQRGKKLQVAGEKANQLLDAHDAAVKNIYERNNLKTGNIKSIKESLSELVEAFANKKMHVQIHYNEKNKGLSMVLANHDVDQSILNGSLSQLRKNNNVAIVDLAHINGDGTISRGTQNRVARLIAQREGKGGYTFATGFDEIISAIAGNAGYATDMLKLAGLEGRKNGMLQVENYLNGRARKTLQNLSMNNRFGNPKNQDAMFDVKSRAANYIRGGVVDVSAFAQEWYEGWYASQSDQRKDLWKLKTPEEVMEAARENKEMYVNSMGRYARNVFNRQVDGFVNEKFGLNLGTHSLRDTHVSNYLRSNLDARSLLAFGYFNPMARENIMKTVNYMALNEDDVRRKLLEAGFDRSEIRRMSQRGVVSETATKVMEEFQGEGKLSYINMRAAYMNDSQLKERATELAERYEALAQIETDPTKKAQLLSYAEKVKSVERISTYDGMMIMSEEVARAFETTREKKVKLSAGATLTKEAQQILESLAGQNGIEFDLSKNMSFDKTAHLDRINLYEILNRKPEGVTNLKFIENAVEQLSQKNKVTVSEIVQQELSHMDGDNPVWNTTRKADPNGIIDKWNLSNMRITGWNAEEQALILQEKVPSMNTTKVITEDGGRNTLTLLPGKVVDDLSGGNGARAIMPSFESGKGMNGTELRKYVALAVDEAKAQIYANDKITAKSVAINDALNQINELFHTNFGITNKSLSRVKDGRIVVDDLIGTNDEDKNMAYSLKNVHSFFESVDSNMTLSKLGVNTRLANSNTIMGVVGVGKQDVYDWENSIGLVDEHHSGLVRWGRKEVDMITTRASQVLENKGSHVVGWLKDHIEQAAIAQSHDIRRIGGGLIKTVVDDRHITPDKGDVVIRTTGSSFGSDDPLGIETGRTTDRGVREISMHTLNELPEVTARDMKLVSDAYVGTILDFGRSKVGFSDGTNLQDALRKNGGTALLEMPDASFAQKYVRLVDFGDITRGATETPILREIQKLQQQIWRGIKKYQSIKGMDEGDPEEITRVRNRVDELVEQYRDKVASTVFNARDDGLLKSFGAAKMDNSGRFRIQGVNPFANYEEIGKDAKGNPIFDQGAGAKYQEGNIYVSRQRMAEMIKGSESSIADVLKIKVDGLTGEDLTNKVLDNINDKGLYGFVNRYPTIKQSAVQAMRFMIDDEMTAANNRGAVLTVGTAYRLKADYDGDFLSGVLAHYSTRNAKEIHGELAILQREEAREARKVSMEKLLPDLYKDMGNTAKQMNMTVGELSKLHNEAAQIFADNGVAGSSEGAIKLLLENKTITDKQVQAYQAFTRIHTTRMNELDAIETREARLGKEFVGIVDNTRDKVLNLVTATVNEFEANGRMNTQVARTYRNRIEDFTQRFSQELISAKKFSIEDEVQRLVGVAAQEGRTLNRDTATAQAIQNFDNRWEKFLDMNAAIMNPTKENLELFRQHNEEVQLYKTTSKKEMQEMDQALEMVQNVSRWNAKAGGYRNMSLLLNVSEGDVGADEARTFLSGQGHMIVPTQAAEEVSSLAHGETTEDMERGMRRWRRQLNTTFDDIQNGGTTSLVDALGERAYNANDHVLSGATAADEASVKLGNFVNKFTPKIMMEGGFGGGALMFGAMWAASAALRSGPTPEGLQEQTAPPAPVAKQVLQGAPTARITENNGEYVNIRVSAKGAQGMSEQDIAALVHQEIGAMTSMKMDTTLNVTDNTQNIDQQWLQGVVANAVNKGFAF